jgi:hypothetical protein
MLYTTILTEVKTILNDYLSYNLTSSGLDDLLSIASIDAEYWMKKYIGIVFYDAIKAKNNVGLTDYESVIVRSEIYAIASQFLYIYDSKSKSIQGFGDAQVADVRISNSGKTTGTESIAVGYLNKAKSYLNLVGINTTPQLTRNMATSSYNPLEIVDGYYGINLDWPERYK